MGIEESLFHHHRSEKNSGRAFLTKLGIPENHRVYGCAALGYAAAAPVKERQLAEGTVTIIK